MTLKNLMNDENVKRIMFDCPTSKEVALSLKSQNVRATVRYSSDAAGNILHRPLEVGKLLSKKFGEYEIKREFFEGGGSYTSKIDYFFVFSNNEFCLAALEQFDLSGWWEYKWIEKSKVNHLTYEI